jgi:hypothetical protein
MRHLKRYKIFESVNLSKSQHINIVSAVGKLRISPTEDKRPIYEIYDFIFLVLEKPIFYKHSEHFIEEIKCITIGQYHYHPDSWGCIEYHKSLNDAIKEIPVDYSFNLSKSENFEELKLKARNENKEIVKLMDYNPVNYQEIENLLIDYDIEIEDIFGIISKTRWK